MAGKGKKRKPAGVHGARIIVEAYDKKHLRNLMAQKNTLDVIYNEVANEAARIGRATGFDDPALPFVLSDYPQAQRRMNELVAQMGEQLCVSIEKAEENEWMLSVEKNARMIDALVANTKIGKDAIAEWKEPNLSALRAFQQRKRMNLADRVWNITEQTRQELELALDLGLGEGKSAAELSRDVRKYLNEPEKLFRRVRDKHGALHLSKRAKAYHPGHGVYRSSYKNALRMTATETNMAYHAADHDKWSRLPLVKGIRIELSNNHTVRNAKGQRVPLIDICDELQGDYPKDFKFPGWHPFCRCFAVPITASWEEIEQMWQAEERGEDISDWHFKDEVKDMPECFTSWIDKNQERISRAKSMPYFIKDNYHGGEVSRGFRWKKEKKNAKA